jgi:hypothetical protein
MINSFAERIEAVTADQAGALAAERLVPANRAVLTYLNTAAPRAEAAAAGTPGAGADEADGGDAR